MPTTDAINTGAAKHFVYPPLVTRLSTDEDPPTTAAEISSVLQAQRVVRSAGGQELDYFDVEWKVTSALINRIQPADFTRMADALLPDVERTRLAFGDYTVETEEVGDSETLTAQVQIRGYHYGVPFAGQRWYEPVTNADETTEFPPVFNPRIDDKILPNRSSKKRDDSEDAYLWVHPEGVLTTTAQTANDQSAPSSWDLLEAVLAMCWACNPDEDFFTNPTRSELSVLSSAPDIEDVRLPLGLYLPDYLDALLQPLGYNWTIDYDTGFGGDYLGTYADVDAADAANPSPGGDDTFYNEETGTVWERNEANDGWQDTEAVPSELALDKNNPKIVVFQQGAGTEKELFFQAPDEVLDLDDSNCNEYRIERRIGDSINQVRVVGDVEKAEVTLELKKGWATASDSLTAEELTKETGDEYEANPTVHRLWVFNEAGDYNGLRTEIVSAPDLSTVFSKYFPHRRTPEDPFSFQGTSGKLIRRQIYVEYTIDGGSSWQPIPDSFGQPFILPDQCGLIFQGDAPPEDLIDASSDAGVRMTCVIAGDARISHTATRRSAEAVNGRTVEVVIDRPEKFRKHWVQGSGTWASIFSGLSAGADTVDDSTAIQSFAEDIRDQHEVAEIDGSVSLPGFHTYYEIGDLITNIAGREVSLDMASDTGTSRYPQVVGIEWINTPPTTILRLDRGTREATA